MVVSVFSVFSDAADPSAPASSIASSSAFTSSSYLAAFSAQPRDADAADASACVLSTRSRTNAASLRTSFSTSASYARADFVVVAVSFSSPTWNATTRARSPPRLFVAASTSARIAGVRTHAPSTDSHMALRAPTTSNESASEKFGASVVAFREKGALRSAVRHAESSDSAEASVNASDALANIAVHPLLVSRADAPGAQRDAPGEEAERRSNRRADEARVVVVASWSSFERLETSPHGHVAAAFA